MKGAAMIPLWKVKRELARLRLQLAQWHWFLFGTARRRAHDAARARLVTVTEGAAPLTPDVAILLCYQPGGVLTSFLAEVDHFRARGFAPVVVSNLPLSGKDLSALQSRAHLVIQRPNYGYDFGGYREGIKTLWDRGVTPRNLVIKNDSIWFPIWPDDDLLDRALADPADLWGLYLNQSVRRGELAHLQSYFYRFSGRLCAAPEFREWWENLFLSDNKHAVIHQCEIKLTGWFRDRGFSTGSLVDTARLRAALLDLDEAALLQVLAYQAQVETRIAPWVAPILAAGRITPEDRALIAEKSARGAIGSYLMISHPSVLLDRLKMPVLKKDRQAIYALQRREIGQSSVAAGLLPMIRVEIAQWDGTSPRQDDGK